jgi:hypothetical protein
MFLAAAQGLGSAFAVGHRHTVNAVRLSTLLPVVGFYDRPREGFSF